MYKHHDVSTSINVCHKNYMHVILIQKINFAIIFIILSFTRSVNNFGKYSICYVSLTMLQHSFHNECDFNY